jgi:hypothetical protein
MRTVCTAGGGVGGGVFGTGSAQRLEGIASGARMARAIANPELL